MAALLPIRYTQHALEKFQILKRYNFPVTQTQVEEVIRSPESTATQTGGRYVVQRSISTRHVLRVVYRKAADAIVVITFYPGRRSRYEDPP